MFAVVPLDSPFSSWPVWLVLAVWLGLASLFGIAVLFAWARWGDGWDRLREHSVPVSAAILLLIAGVTAWRWWSGPSKWWSGPSQLSTPDRLGSRVGAGGGSVLAPWQRGLDWPMDRGSAARLGIAPGGVGPGSSSPKVRWRFGRPEEAFYASPAVSGNRLYAVGSEGDSGRVVALELATGRLAWSGGPPGMRATFASPVVAGQQLFCGEGLHATRDARLFVLALSSEPTESARLLWSFPTRGHIECTPTVVARSANPPSSLDGGLQAGASRDGKSLGGVGVGVGVGVAANPPRDGGSDRIYFQAGDDGVYALSSGFAGENGESARLVFHNQGARYADAETALLVDGGLVYAGLGRGGEAVCLLDAATGRELDRLPTDWPVFAPPAASGSSVFIGMGDADFANPSGGDRNAPVELRGAGRRAATSQGRAGTTGDSRTGGAVWRLERGTLRVVWRRELPGAVLGLVACPGGEVIAGCGDGRVYAIAADNGNPRSWSTGAALSAPLAVAGQYVYGVNHGGWLFAIDRQAAGESLAWRWRIGEPGPYVSGPVVAGEWLVVGTPNDGLICVEPDSSHRAHSASGL
ncbi:MAG: hypothetical protein RLY70_2979 [Planctomycetota bacterium]